MENHRRSTLKNPLWILNEFKAIPHPDKNKPLKDRLPHPLHNFLSLGNSSIPGTIYNTHNPFIFVCSCPRQSLSVPHSRSIPHAWFLGESPGIPYMLAGSKTPVKLPPLGPVHYMHDTVHANWIMLGGTDQPSKIARACILMGRR